MNAREQLLWERVKHLPFWCETCHGWHPLHEHADCRGASIHATAARARQAIAKEDTHDDRR